MGSYEYKVVPAPVRGRKGPGVRGPEGRFAHSLEQLMNEMAAEGWEYQRAETLPSEEKHGLVSAAQTIYRNVLVFRRQRSADLSAFDPRVIGEDRQQPLLLPPADGQSDSDSADGNSGLPGILRRRAARTKTDDNGVEEHTPEELDDLAARFADDDDEDRMSSETVDTVDTESDSQSPSRTSTAAE